MKAKENYSCAPRRQGPTPFLSFGCRAPKSGTEELDQVSLPPACPDLTSLDFFKWGYVKNFSREKESVTYVGCQKEFA